MQTNRALTVIAALASLAVLPSVTVGAETDAIETTPSPNLTQMFNTLPACDNENGVKEIFVINNPDKNTATFTSYNEDLQNIGNFSVNLPSQTIEKTEKYYMGTGMWNTYTITYEIYAKIEAFNYLGSFGNWDEDKFASKHFFNDDDNYEYFVTDFSYEERGNIPSGDEGTIEKGNFPSGYILKNDKGETLGKISGTGKICLVELGGKRYVGVAGKNEAQWYKINAASSGSALVPVAKLPISVAPRMARRSTPVTVTVPAEAGSQRTVTVVSTTGRTLLTSTLAPDTDTLNIDTTDFAAGIYIVNVTTGTSVTENCKIVIR